MLRILSRYFQMSAEQRRREHAFISGDDSDRDYRAD